MCGSNLFLVDSVQCLTPRDRRWKLRRVYAAIYRVFEMAAVEFREFVWINFNLIPICKLKCDGTFQS